MMERELKKVNLPPESDLAHMLKEATRSGQLVVVDTGEALYSLSVDILDDRSRAPGAGDVASSIEGILKAAGGWKGIVDADEFKTYIHKRRRTSSRPSIRL